MKKRLKYLLVFYFTFIMLLLPFGCSKTPDENFSSNDNQDEPIVEQTLNPLTGLAMESDYKDKRPVAIMINNIKQAQPLLGVSDADIMYECPVEGGITRIMAIFKDPRNIEKIGSVRSARPYFITIARGLDAIYMHVGGSKEALSILSSGVLDHFDLGNHSNMMWRDSDRAKTMSYEHTAVTSGKKLIAGIEKAHTRYNLKQGYSFGQTFGDNSQVLNGRDATSLKVKFSGYKSTSFKYDPEKNTYLISQFNTKQMDSNKGVQNSKQNVIVMHVNTYDVDSTGHKGMDLISSGKGYYMSNGKIIDIKWSKSSANSPFVYKTTSGENLIMLPGQTYICCTPLNSTVTESTE